ncbi:hypothetical protein [Flavobacterium selenitireducens]|uniref:hypothetical protein n=1 Tax=Flavobacterium selenitireducens TaxID=2722704 RepID=UPI00168BBFB4|nr:hypothetical protein [Flavobacterium selenitireducens]MBD3581852.1 hypothetical protein [Flavobacterium selenitireducens]
MPANPKYLTATFWPRFSKITAAIIGSYFVTMTFHLMLASYLDKNIVTITSAYTAFLLWVTLMILTFVANNGWKVWGIFLVLSAVFAGITYAAHL